MFGVFLWRHTSTNVRENVLQGADDDSILVKVTIINPVSEVPLLDLSELFECNFNSVIRCRVPNIPFPYVPRSMLSILLFSDLAMKL